MRVLWIAMIIGACGGAPPGAKPPGASSSGSRVAAAEPAPEAICARLAALRDEHCGSFTGVELRDAECPQAFRAAQQGAPSSSRLAMRALGRCVVANPL